MERSIRSTLRPLGLALAAKRVAELVVRAANLGSRTSSAGDATGHNHRLAHWERRWRKLQSPFKDLELTETQCFDRFFKFHGPMKSTAQLTDQDRLDACLFYQYREKSECALTAASSYYGGDYMEFGALDLNTFRNFLSAYDIFKLDDRFPDTRFYAFDIFGKMETTNPETQNFVDEMEASLPYFSKFTLRGDLLEEHHRYVEDHALYKDRCHLVQGYFHDTLSESFKARLIEEGRSIGFAFLDCNRPENYRIVFEWIYEILGDHSYIYLDEYLQVPGVREYFEDFAGKLKARGLNVTYIRNAAGFGALFRVWPNQILKPLRIDTGVPEAAASIVGSKSSA
jgi:hypothetical protein